MFTDGPFTELKEVVNGYYQFEAPDLETAKRLAALVPRQVRAAVPGVRPQPAGLTHSGAQRVNELDPVFRREWAHLLATLIRYTGSPELAEDALQEAFARASASRDRTLLINPAAWITTVAKRIAVDTARRDAALSRRLPLLARDQPEAAPSSVIDDRLELVLLACSPSLAPDQRIALSLRFVFGVGTAAIADAMLVQHTAMSARLTRAKRRIERDGIGGADRARVDDALAVIHVLYTIGHTLPQGNELADRGVATTAVELARALRGLHPTDPETAGLLALLLLTEARAPGRTDGDGVVTVEAADRTRWNRAAIAEGIALATVALPGGGRFALEAGISGLHSSARPGSDTDWEAISRSTTDSSSSGRRRRRSSPAWSRAATAAAGCCPRSPNWMRSTTSRVRRRGSTSRRARTSSAASNDARRHGWRTCVLDPPSRTAPCAPGSIAGSTN